MQLISRLVQTKWWKKKNKILKEIAKLQKKVTEVFQKWQFSNSKENLLQENFSDTVSNSFVTEPLLHCQDLEDLVNCHFGHNNY